MFDLKRVVKARMINAIEILPYGRDLYLKLAGHRVGITYRGNFNSRPQAQAAISKKKNNQYDIINSNKADNKDRENSALDTWFDDNNYPLLFWLSQTLSEGGRVLELGGSVGRFFYSIQKYIDLPKDISWIIAELPEAVALGKKLASERQERCLDFLDSANISSAPPTNIFVTAGTLQYMDLELPQILAELPELPSHVLSHNLPVHQNLSYITLQNLKVCEVPYRIYSRLKLESEMRQLGYSLKTSWTHEREVEIPFHRDLQIDGYCGHYFVLEDQGK